MVPLRDVAGKLSASSLLKTSVDTQQQQQQLLRQQERRQYKMIRVAIGEPPPAHSPSAEEELERASVRMVERGASESESEEGSGSLEFQRNTARRFRAHRFLIPAADSLCHNLSD